MRRRLQIHLWVFMAVFLGSCRSETIPCTVTRTPDGTLLYSVPEYSGSQCAFSWSENETVIANNEAKLGQVVACTNRTLETQKCLEKINFSCYCLYREDIIATCSTNCTGDAAPQDGKKEGTPANHVIIPVAVIVLALIIGGCCFAMYKRGLFSWAGCSNQQDGGDVV